MNEQYYIYNGKLVDRATLVSKYGDGVDDAIKKHGFEAAYQFNGNLVGESTLKQKYGDIFADIISSKGITPYSPPKQDQVEPAQVEKKSPVASPSPIGSQGSPAVPTSPLGGIPAAPHMQPTAPFGTMGPAESQASLGSEVVKPVSPVPQPQAAPVADQPIVSAQASEDPDRSLMGQFASVPPIGFTLNWDYSRPSKMPDPRKLTQEIEKAALSQAGLDLDSFRKKANDYARHKELGEIELQMYVVDGKPVSSESFKDLIFDQKFIEDTQKGLHNVQINPGKSEYVGQFLDQELVEAANRNLQSGTRAGDKWDSFMSGASRMASGVVGMETMYLDVVEEVLGIPLRRDLFGVDELQEKSEDLAKKADDYQKKTFQYRDSFLNSVMSGKWSDAVQQAGDATAASVPYSAGAAALTYAGGPALAFSVLAPMSSSAEYASMKVSEDEAFAELSRAEKLLRSSVVGPLEAGTDMIAGRAISRSFDLTKGLYRGLVKDVAENQGLEAADKAARELSKSVIRKYGENIGLQMTEEFFAEGGSAGFIMLYDDLMGIRSYSAKDYVSEILNNGLLGSAAGGITTGTLGGPSAIYAAGLTAKNALRSVFDKKLYEDPAAVENLSKRVDGMDVPEDVKEDLKQNLAKREKAVKAVPEELVSDTETVNMAEQRQELEEKKKGLLPVFAAPIETQIEEIDGKLAQKATDSKKQEAEKTKESIRESARKEVLSIIDNDQLSEQQKDEVIESITSSAKDLMKAADKGGLMPTISFNAPTLEIKPAESQLNKALSNLGYSDADISSMTFEQRMEIVEKGTEKAEVVSSAKVDSVKEAERLDAREKRLAELNAELDSQAETKPSPAKTGTGTISEAMRSLPEDTRQQSVDELRALAEKRKDSEIEALDSSKMNNKQLMAAIGEINDKYSAVTGMTLDELYQDGKSRGVSDDFSSAVEAMLTGDKAQENKPTLTQPSKEPVSESELNKVEEVEGALRPINDETISFRQPLSNFTNALYRETDEQGLRELIDPMLISDTSSDRLFWSNTKDLAEGQGQNRGFVVKMKPIEGIEGNLNTSKPAFRISYDNGAAEFTTTGISKSKYSKAVESVTIKPDAKFSNNTTKKRVMEALSSWTKTKNEDGSTTYTRPRTDAIQEPSAETRPVRQEQGTRQGVREEDTQGKETPREGKAKEEVASLPLPSIKSGKAVVSEPIVIFRGEDGMTRPDGTRVNANQGTEGRFAHATKAEAMRYSKDGSVLNVTIPKGTTVEVVEIDRKGMTPKEYAAAETAAINASDAQVVKLHKLDGKIKAGQKFDVQYIIKDRALLEGPKMAKKYKDRITKIKESDPVKYWSVDVPSDEVIDSAANDGRIVDVKGGMGIVTEDGDMVGLFKYDPKAKGTAEAVQMERVKKGGIKLDNFDGKLTEIYEKNGFRVVSRLPFNESQAPAGWSKEKHGTPDVVFMIYDPLKKLSIKERKFSDYGKARAYRDSFVEKAREAAPKAADADRKSMYTVSKDGAVVEVEVVGSKNNSLTVKLPNGSTTVRVKSEVFSDRKKAHEFGIEVARERVSELTDALIVAAVNGDDYQSIIDDRSAASLPIAESKRVRGLPVVDKAREKIVYDAARKRVNELGGKWADVKPIITRAIAESIATQEAYIAKKSKTTGEQFNKFFTDVSAGTKGFSDVKYEPVLTLTDTDMEFAEAVSEHRGNFDDHIAKSIPGHREVQVKKGAALSSIVGPDDKVLDIGGSEGSFAKGVTILSGANSVTVDPNDEMKSHSDKTPVPGNEYVNKPFMEGWAGNPAWEPTEKYDVVHESMTFQFINGNRAAQVSYIVSEVLDKNGVLLLEEKFSEEKDDAGEWKANEDQKDEYKAKYFTPEELETKRKEVLSTGVSETEGMHSRMVSRSEMEAILKKNFAHVAPYWVSGNFAGYIATNNKQKFDAFMSSISDTSSIFSTPPSPTSPSRREDSKVTTRKLVNPDLLGLKERYVNESGMSVEQAGETGKLSKDHIDILEALHRNADDDRSNPVVVASYRAFMKETKDQFEFLRANGYDVRPFLGEGEPYGVDSRKVREDLKKNKRLQYLMSRAATGADGDAALSADEYILFEETGIEIDGVPVLYNDAFRGVHDVMGHGIYNNSFSTQGEFAAYLFHSNMYSPEAQLALFLETVSYNAYYSKNGQYAPRKMYPIDPALIEEVRGASISPKQEPVAKEKPAKPSKKSLSEEAKALADAIRKGKLDNDITFSGIPFAKQVWNAAVEAVALAVQGGAAMADAVAKGIEVIKASDWYKGLKSEDAARAESFFSKKMNDQVGSAAVPPPNKKTKQSTGPKRRTRKKAFVNRALDRYRDNEQMVARLKELGLRYDVVSWKDVLPLVQEIIHEAESTSGNSKAAMDALMKDMMQTPLEEWSGNPALSTMYAQLGHAVIDWYRSNGHYDEWRNWLEQIDLLGRSSGRFISALQDASGSLAIMNIEIAKYVAGNEREGNKTARSGTKFVGIDGKPVSDPSDIVTVDEIISEIQKKLQLSSEEIKSLQEKVKELSDELEKKKAEKPARAPKPAEPGVTTGDKRKLAQQQRKEATADLLAYLKGKRKGPGSGPAMMAMVPIDPELQAIVDKLINAALAESFYTLKEVTESVMATIKSVAPGEKDLHKSVKQYVKESFETEEDVQDQVEEEEENALLDKMVARAKKRAKDKMPKPKTAEEVFLDAVLGKIDEIIETTKRKPTDSSGARILEILRNRDIADASWRDAITAVETWLNGQVATGKMEPGRANYVLAAIVDNASMFMEQPFKESDLRRQVRNGIKSMGEALSDVVKRHFSERNLFAETLEERIIRELGVTESEAAFLSEPLMEQLEQMMEKTRKTEIKKLLDIDDAGLPKERAAARNLVILDKVLAAMNLGVLDNSVFKGLFSEKYGFADFTPDTLKAIQYFAGLISETKGTDMALFYEKKLADLLASKRKKNFTFLAQMYQGMMSQAFLTGITTEIVSVMGGSLATFTMSKGFNVARTMAPTLKFMMSYPAGLKGLGRRSALDVLRYGFSTTDSDARYGVQPPQKGDPINQASIDFVKGRAIKEIVSLIRSKNPGRIPAAVGYGMLEGMSTVLQIARLSGAFDMPLRLRSKEHYEYVANMKQVASEMGIPVNAISAFSKRADVAKVVAEVERRMGYDSITMTEAEAAADAVIEKMKDAGQKIPYGARQRMILGYIEKHRESLGGNASEHLNNARKKAASDVLMERPEGLLGQLNEKVQGMLAIKDSDGSLAAGSKLLGTALAGLFFRVMISSARVTARSIPFVSPAHMALQAWSPNFLPDYVTKTKVRVTDPKTGKVTMEWMNPLEVDPEKWKDNMLIAASMTGLFMGLFAAMFELEDEEDEEGNVKVRIKPDKDAPFFVTGDAAVPFFGLEHMRIKGMKQMTPWTIYYKDGDSYAPIIQGRLAPPMLPLIGFLGSLGDAVYIGKPDKTPGESAEKRSASAAEQAVMSAAGSLNAFLSLSYATAPRTVTSAVTAFKRAEKQDEALPLFAAGGELLAQASGPLTVPMYPPIFRDIYHDVATASGKPEKYGQGFLYKMTKNFPVFDDMYSINKTDVFGYPVTRDFRLVRAAKEIPLISAVTYDAVSHMDANGKRFENPVWKMKNEIPHLNFVNIDQYATNSADDFIKKAVQFELHGRATRDMWMASEGMFKLLGDTEDPLRVSQEYQDKVIAPVTEQLVRSEVAANRVIEAADKMRDLQAAGKVMGMEKGKKELDAAMKNLVSSLPGGVKIGKASEIVDAGWLFDKGAKRPSWYTGKSSMIAPLLTAIKDDSWKASSNSDWANEVSSELDPDHAKAIWYAEKYPDKAVKMIFEDDNLSKALLASVKFSTMKSTASKLKDFMKDNAEVARMIGDGTGITDLVDMEIINKMVGDISITPAQHAERRLRWDAENEELIRMQRTLLPGQGLKSYME